MSYLFMYDSWLSDCIDLIHGTFFIPTAGVESSFDAGKCASHNRGQGAPFIHLHVENVFFFFRGGRSLFFCYFRFGISVVGIDWNNQ